MKMTLRVKRIDRPELVAYDRILRHYGSGCYVQELQEREDHWKVPIGAYFPSKVVDEKTRRERILTFNLQNVGEILVKKSTMRVLKATPLSSLGRNILGRRVEIRNTVERDLIKVFGKPEMTIRFSQLKYALAGLQPIYRTINRLLLEDYPSYEELSSIYSRSGQNYLEQVELLIDIGYAEYTKQQPIKLVGTNKIKDLFSQEKDIGKTVDTLLGMVLSEFYYDLRKGMRIAQFVPYVRASTSYYGDAIQFGKLISISEGRLYENMKEYYRGAPLPARVRYAYPTMVRELVDAQILDYNGDYITGRDNIFEKLIDIRDKLPITEEPISFG